MNLHELFCTRKLVGKRLVRSAVVPLVDPRPVCSAVLGLRCTVRRLMMRRCLAYSKVVGRAGCDHVRCTIGRGRHGMVLHPVLAFVDPYVLGWPQ